MKRVMCILLVLSMLIAGVAMAASEQSVCSEIAKQMQDSFTESSPFNATAEYDADKRIIQLTLTAKAQDHAFYEEKRKDNDMQPLYDMLANLNVYKTCKSNMDRYSVTGVDIYLILYSSDGVVEYVEINGRNISELLLETSTVETQSPKTPEDILNRLIELNNTQYVLAFGDVQGEMCFLAMASKLPLDYDAFMQTDTTKVVSSTINLSKRIAQELEGIGATGLTAIAAFYTYNGKCICVAFDGVDVTDQYREICEDWVNLTY